MTEHDYFEREEIIRNLEWLREQLETELETTEEMIDRLENGDDLHEAVEWWTDAESLDEIAHLDPPH